MSFNDIEEAVSLIMGINRRLDPEFEDYSITAYSFYNVRKMLPSLWV